MGCAYHFIHRIRGCFRDFHFYKETEINDIKAILAWLITEKETRSIEFVHGIGKRKTNIQKWTEQLEEYRDHKKSYVSSKEMMKGRNSYSKTGPNMTFMHMKDDYMRNSQLKPGYNVQIAVESEYVTSVGSFKTGQTSVH